MEHMGYTMGLILGAAVTLLGCILGFPIVYHYLEAKARVKRAKAAAQDGPYIWVDVEDRLPEQRNEYLVEYYFERYNTRRFRAVYEFYPQERRFQYEGPENGLKVVRWAPLPE